MNLLPFENLPAYRPRTFVPAGVDWGNWDQIAPLYDQLESRAAKCKSAAALEQWLVDWGELNAALDEDGSRRYIAMTCHTDNPDAEKAYLHFVEHIQPQLKPREFKLAQIFIAHPLRAQLPPSRYGVFDRNTEVQVELFRPENVPLETEEAKLGQQYQKLNGSLTVHFAGEERTLVQMARYLEEPDRAVRQETWELVADRRLRESDKMDEIFDGLVKLREQIARNAGFKNYVDYSFRNRRRFDYAPEDCLRFHEAIADEIMPVLRELQTKRREQMGLAALRPWDLAVDPPGRPPLRPFGGVGDMAAKTQLVFNRLDPALAGEFQHLRELRLLDLANRKGKRRRAVINRRSPKPACRSSLMNAVGLQRDVETLLHEAGHAFHALAGRTEELYAYRDAPIEFCEVASMSMELLGNEFMEDFYAPPEARRARHDHLEGIVKLFPWVATVDAFQHWIYSHPGHRRQERAAAWEGLMDRFGGDVDWRGYETTRASLWHRQLHIFLHPFYYVEYGLAQLGALQVWANSKRDAAQALADYKRALGLAGSRPLPELFRAAGCKFEFGRGTIKPLMELVRTEMARLN